ncbi:MAG TPA: PEGA domain-containing protein [Polyangia bacterium]|nr:PEGA domain-containing protein [Polyangia bacterium]
MGSSRSAAAEDSAPDPALQAAKEFFETAQTLFLKEQYEAAAEKFLAAFDKKPFAAFLFNTAVSYEKAKKLDLAKQYFEQYLEKDPQASDAAQVKARIETIKTLLEPPAPAVPPPPALGPEGTPLGPPAGAAPGTPPVAPLAVSAPSLPAIDTKGLVVIDSKPQGATIYLNDKKNGAFAHTPWQGSLESQPVRLLLESKGFKPEQRQISPRSDKLVDVYIALSEEHYLGWIEIISNAQGALVYIDKKEIGAIGRTPYTGHLKPGKHTIYLEKMGFKPAEMVLDVSPGTATQHTITMQQADNGWINVVGRGTSGGRLLIDKKLACATPCRAEVSPGKHAVVVAKDGMENFESDLVVARTVETTIEVQFVARPPRTKAITAAIIGAALLGIGGYVGHLGQSTRDEIKSDIAANKLIDNGDPRYRRAKLEFIGADVLFGLGAIVGISAVVSFIYHGADSVGVVDQKSISLAPEVMSGGAGLTAAGRF